MKERDEGSLEFRSATGVDGRRRESLPYDRLADVCRDEEGYTAPESVAFLQQFIEENDKQTCYHQLKDEKEHDSRTEITWLTVETR